MNKIKPLLSGSLLLLLLWAMNTKIGAVPPLGKFFDPQGGFWAQAETSLPDSETFSIPGLKQEVRVYFDERRVPHVFAQNEEDLYLAQGYLVAKDRLFQMEMQTYDAAGRLSELIGPQLLERDLRTRRWGLPYGAEKNMKEVEKDRPLYQMLKSYSDGVNAYISQLDPEDYPLEYKVLDLQPEPWQPHKTALYLMNMTRTLASSHYDDETSNTLAYFGEEFVNTFITRPTGWADPIIPEERKWAFEPETPEKPDSLFVPEVSKKLKAFHTPDGIGSNNWAVSGSKTASGFPILANDPHLELSLPSVWYEVQLHAPGLNIYGVTMQGAPGIIIGFNENVAWGVTNVGSDVLDWYEIKFKDKSRKEYWHDGQWKKTTQRVEEFKVRGQETVRDTVIYTHHGPVSEFTVGEGAEEKKVYHAMRWVGHDGSRGMRVFYELNRASNYEDYTHAMKYWDAPAQNFAFASREGDIALWVNGKFPHKWEKQGFTISDGTDAKYDWQGWIPRDQVPHIKNPARGFVSSANQESAGSDYPYYMGYNFAPFERGKRINDLLGEMEDITPEDMMRMQMDDFSYYAANLLPYLIRWIEEQELTEEELEWMQRLRNWDYHMDADKAAPSVFNRWARHFYDAVLEDEYRSAGAELRKPDRDHFVKVVISDPDLPYFDNIYTPQKESREDQALLSFRNTLKKLEQRYGTDPENWKWGVVINNDIDHLASIPGFGARDLFSSGAAEAVNATRGGYGPSWRMVVELGPEVKGWGVYPGGSSGNPGSPNYDHMLNDWRTGHHFELDFMKEEPSEYSYKYILLPEETD